MERADDRGRQHHRLSLLGIGKPFEQFAGALLGGAIAAPRGGAVPGIRIRQRACDALALSVEDREIDHRRHHPLLRGSVIPARRGHRVARCTAPFGIGYAEIILRCRVVALSGTAVPGERLGQILPCPQVLNETVASSVEHRDVVLRDRVALLGTVEIIERVLYRVARPGCRLPVAPWDDKLGVLLARCARRPRRRPGKPARKPGSWNSAPGAVDRCGNSLGCAQVRCKITASVAVAGGMGKRR